MGEVEEHLAAARWAAFYGGREWQQGMPEDAATELIIRLHNATQHELAGALFAVLSGTPEHLSGERAFQRCCGMVSGLPGARYAGILSLLIGSYFDAVRVPFATPVDAASVAGEAVARFQILEGWVHTICAQCRQAGEDLDAYRT